jgi:RNA polymerase-binding transcription factor DksA
VTDASDEPIEIVAAVDDAPTEQTVTYVAASEARVEREPELEPAAPALDLEQITRDLEGVAMALTRLDDGTYWTDEVTGEPLAEELLAADPVARRNR